MEKLLIPIKIFRDKKLGAVESLVYYLSVDKGMRNCDIARLLNKNDRNITNQIKSAKLKKEV